MTDTKFVVNPDWGEQQLNKARRGELQASCHDGTDYLTLLCQLRHANHVHRSQLEPLPSGVQVGARCQTCGREIILNRDETLEAMDWAWGRR